MNVSIWVCFHKIYCFSHSRWPRREFGLLLFNHVEIIWLVRSQPPCTRVDFVWLWKIYDTHVHGTEFSKKMKQNSTNVHVLRHTTLKWLHLVYQPIARSTRRISSNRIALTRQCITARPCWHWLMQEIFTKSMIYSIHIKFNQTDHGHGTATDGTATHGVFQSYKTYSTIYT
jgi:hypothetical protein